MSDLDMMAAERLRRAMHLKYGVVDFEDFVDQLCAMKMDQYGLESRCRRLEI